MIALNHDTGKVFIYQPSSGLMVPIVIDLRSRKISVQVPRTSDLEDDYESFEDMNDLLRSVDPSDLELISLALRASFECTRLYQDRIKLGEITVAELRWLFEKHLARPISRRIKAEQKRADPVEATLEETFSVG